MTQGRISIANTTNIDTLLAARHQDEEPIKLPTVHKIKPIVDHRIANNPLQTWQKWIHRL